MFLRKFFRLNLSDGFSMAFLLTAVVSEYLFEVFIVLPVTEQGIVPLFIHVILGSYVVINILFNFAMVLLVDTTTKGVILPAVLKPMWNFCAACEANAPPRAFHCDKCKVCVLKRDHHCVFAGRCIGLKNFRFFVVFLFYLSIGCLYATFFNMYFIWDVLGGFSLFSLAAHIVPFVFWLLGYLNLTTFIYTLLSMLGVVGFLFVTNLLVFHVKQMMNNQTTFEKNNGHKMFDLGWRRNLVEAFGPNWHLVWIWPLVKSPIPSDGLEFKMNQTPDTFYSKTNIVGNARLRNT